ncbi:MAG: trimeric intracellular cation channel family protein [Flavobacteriales bacterium]|nr:trimeric intracellular cation channel family protein [Flavobacteriales bacterium]
MLDWNLINFIDISGTFVFAVSGVMVGIKKQFDFFGVIILAFVTAIGGGTLRDILIGSTPVSWMKNEIYGLVILSAVPVCYFFSAQLRKVRRTFFLFDTVGIGLFTVLGVEKSLDFGLHPLIAVMMGVVSAVFGGILRDVLSNDVPLVFRKEVYAFACLAGALAYLGLSYLPISTVLNEIIAISVVISIRLLSLWYKWSIPFNPR